MVRDLLADKYFNHIYPFLVINTVWRNYLETQDQGVSGAVQEMTAAKSHRIVRTGLHVADVHQLVNILHALAEGGNTVVVIEHNLDLIKNADYIIDLGPEGGTNGGNIVCFGTPEQVADCVMSYTGQYLSKELM
jgi:hypothetical protein